MSRPGWSRCLLVAITSAGIAGCNPAERENQEPSPAATASPAAKAAPGAAAAPPSVKNEAPGASGNLRTGIQPPASPAESRPTPPPEAPADEKALLAGAESLAKTFFEALRAGDRERARGLVFSEKDFENAVTPGHRVIIQSTIAAQNDLVVEKLVEALRGKDAKAVWKPGELATGAKGVFQKPLPILSRAALDIDLDGAPITILLDQMVHIDEGWRIFRLSLP